MNTERTHFPFQQKLGIISTVVLIVIALITLGYFNISFKSIAEAPIVKENLLYAWGLIVTGFKNAGEFIVDTFVEFFKNR